VVRITFPESIQLILLDKHIISTDRTTSKPAMTSASQLLALVSLLQESKVEQSMEARKMATPVSQEEVVFHKHGANSIG
jgi:hypothetical protein